MSSKVSFSVTKEKIIRTDELLQMFATVSNELEELKPLYKVCKSKNKNLTNDNDLLKIENERLKFNYTTLKADTAKLTEQRDSLQIEWNSLEKKYSQHIVNNQTQIQDLKNEQQMNLELKLAELKEKCSTYKNQLTAQKRQVNSLTVENERLRLLDTHKNPKKDPPKIIIQQDILINKDNKIVQSLDPIAQDIDNNGKIIKDLKAKENELQKKIYKLTLDNEKLKTEMESLKLEANLVQAELKQQINQIESDLKDQKNQFQSKIIKLKKVNSPKKPKITECTQCGELKNQLNCLELEVQMLVDENNNLKSQNNKMDPQTKMMVTETLSQEVKNSAVQTEFLVHDLDCLYKMLFDMNVPEKLSPLKESYFENLPNDIEELTNLETLNSDHDNESSMSVIQKEIITEIHDENTTEIEHETTQQNTDKTSEKRKLWRDQKQKRSLLLRKKRRLLSHFNNYNEFRIKNVHLRGQNNRKRRMRASCAHQPRDIVLDAMLALKKSNMSFTISSENCRCDPSMHCVQKSARFKRERDCRIVKSECCLKECQTDRTPFMLIDKTKDGEQLLGFFNVKNERQMLPLEENKKIHYLTDILQKANSIEKAEKESLDVDSEELQKLIDLASENVKLREYNYEKRQEMKELFEKQLSSIFEISNKNNATGIKNLSRIASPVRKIGKKVTSTPNKLTTEKRSTQENNLISSSPPNEKEAIKERLSFPQNNKESSPSADCEGSISPLNIFSKYSALPLLSPLNERESILKKGSPTKMRPSKKLSFSETTPPIIPLATNTIEQDLDVEDVRPLKIKPVRLSRNSAVFSSNESLDDVGNTEEVKKGAARSTLKKKSSRSSLLERLRGKRKCTSVGDSIPKKRGRPRSTLVNKEILEINSDSNTIETINNKEDNCDSNFKNVQNTSETSPNQRKPRRSARMVSSYLKMIDNDETPEVVHKVPEVVQKELPVAQNIFSKPTPSVLKKESVDKVGEIMSMMKNTKTSTTPMLTEELPLNNNVDKVDTPLSPNQQPSANSSIKNNDDSRDSLRSPEPEVMTSCEDPKIIPLEKPPKMTLCKVDLLFKKLINFSKEKKVVEEVVSQFISEEPEYIAQLVLEIASRDIYDKPSNTHNNYAPPLTETQMVLFGFMVRLDKTLCESVQEHFLKKTEIVMFSKVADVQQANPLSRMYIAICKARKDMDRIRKFCCECFYFMEDLAVPVFFNVLTSWTQVLPKHEASNDCPMAKVLVQLVQLKVCNTPGFNLCPLRDLLHYFYGYPKERQDCNAVFKDIFNSYIGNPSRNTDLSIILFCKHQSDQWVLDKLDKHFKPLVHKIPSENYKATVLVLIGKICKNFRKKGLLNETVMWLESLKSESTTGVLLQAINYCLRYIDLRKKLA
ncbi:unnamed protein product [Brassicogethes aeneus]|uniref:Uncharacterized protein n=1 Tax=Brassicogethes aeneus TaxID=1431903 RepID=A0A9P0AU23_BRAAE|nr:unnamed protein product [Brassicogethes aeneus]